MVDSAVPFDSRKVAVLEQSSNGVTGLLRERMALVRRRLTPVVVYPVLFWGLGAMQEENERKAERSELVKVPRGGRAERAERGHIERVERSSAAEDADATRRSCRRSWEHVASCGPARRSR